MLELVDKYFNEDLSEAEDQILNESLASSDEAASQFMELAEKAYYAFGLPEPHWPGSAPPGVPPAATTFRGPWLGPLVVVTGIAVLGVLGYHYCRVHGQLPGLMPEKPVSEITQTISKPAAAAKAFNPSAGAINPPTGALSGSAGLDKVPVKTNEEKSSLPDQSSSSAVVPALGNQAVPAQPAAVNPPARMPVVTPMAWNEDASKTYSNLSVVVDQPVLGFVTVQVLDAQGGQAALLYRGNLNPGKWVFEWDGKMGGVLPAPSGYYFIQLQSGSQVMRKKIQIH